MKFGWKETECGYNCEDCWVCDNLIETMLVFSARKYKDVTRHAASGENSRLF